MFTGPIFSDNISLENAGHLSVFSKESKTDARLLLKTDCLVVCLSTLFKVSFQGFKWDLHACNELTLGC